MGSGQVMVADALGHVKDAAEGLKFLRACTDFEDTSIENPGAFHTVVQTLTEGSLKFLEEAIECLKAAEKDSEETE